MFVARSGLRELRGTLSRLLAGVVGWIFVAPVARLVPRRRDWIAVVGRHGALVDNAKYFYIQAGGKLAPGMRLVYMSNSRNTFSVLSAAGRECIGLGFWQRTLFSFRVGTVVVDSTDLPWPFLRFALTGARKVQLWHGVGYKRIGLDKWRAETGHKLERLLPDRLLLMLGEWLQRLNGRLIVYDAVVSPSCFYQDQVFKPALRARRWWIAGYPRNTFGKDSASPQNLPWLNVDAALAAQVPTWRETGRRVVLVAPTFRDSGASHTQLGEQDIRQLDAFCRAHGVEFVFKLHPRETGLAIGTAKHLHVCDPMSDAYPLMPYLSALVTDYSSIYMDFLLLDKPVLFLVPDLDHYMQRERSLQFDFDAMTPGPKCRSWSDLLEALLSQWQHDDHAEDRAKLRRLAFDGLPQEQAVPTLLGLMQKEGWLRPGKADAPVQH